MAAETIGAGAGGMLRSLRLETPPGADGARAVVALRWVFVVAIAYLVTFSTWPERSPLAFLLVAVLFASNLLLSRRQGRELVGRAGLAALILFDSVVCSAALLVVPEIEPNILIVYFFVILVAAVGSSLAGVTAAALVLAVVYLLTVAASEGSAAAIESRVLLRIPFLFSVAIFYGYLASIARRESERARAAELAAEARSQVVATLGHDTRNNLGIICSMSEALLEEEEGLGPEGRRGLRAIAAAAVDTLQLIANLVDLSRIETGRLQLARERVDLARVAERVAGRYEIEGEIRSVTLQLVLEGPAPEIEGDSLQLDRAVSNLVHNALKFTPEGGRITIRVQPNADGHGQSVEVDDSGPGVPPEQREEILHAYAQTELGRGHGGTGLGLYVARSIAEAHGGRLEVGEGRNGGALFAMRLPAGGA